MTKAFTAEISRRTLGSLAVAALVSAPWDASATPRCSYSTLESAQAKLGRVNAATLRRDLQGAKEILGDPLFSGFSAILDSCTPSEEDQKVRQNALRALAQLNEEIEYQIGKGISDPRAPADPDDVVDLQQRSRTANTAIEKYYQRAVELNNKSK